MRAEPLGLNRALAFLVGKEDVSRSITSAHDDGRNRDRCKGSGVGIEQEEQSSPRRWDLNGLKDA